MTGMLGVSLVHRGDLALGGGDVIAFAVAWGWLLAMLGLTLFVGLVLVTQLREPGFPLAEVAPLPKPVVPLIALEGSAFLGLGLGLIVRPDFWGELVPWSVSTIDSRALGVWCLTLGVALLQALVEADLDRVGPGLLALTSIGTLGLIGMAWHHSDIAWATWTAPIAVGLLVGLLATGVVGSVLLRRARAATTA
ncbi:hypothetical protein [Knoellia subterranea]|uniref:Uncharacterized protein n=1 Tax=Knoellia subterranea KCTC 19937 TaxID=1385521 RepID=A0A0A0JGC6_9MICO|nr:hypothetical protein [Knoellia subterranea]KGN36183.1 hypothetical protein N803_04805 [Knoellia subterranea KCTC 19937]